MPTPVTFQRQLHGHPGTCFALPEGRLTLGMVSVSVKEGQSMRFRNRAHAARLLAERLAGYRGQHPLVLAIPRGAVPMGHIIAEALDRKSVV